MAQKAFGFNIKLMNSDQDTTYHDFAYAANPAGNILVGGVDPSSISEFDSDEKFTRVGDNLFTPEVYLVETSVVGTSLANLRTQINDIKTAMTSAEVIEITSATGVVYVIAITPVTDVFHHHINVLPREWGVNIVDLVLTFNTASTFVEIQIPTTFPSEGLQLYHDAAQKVYSDAAGTIPATHGDEVQNWGDVNSDTKDATQTAALTKPTYDTTTFTHPTVHFDGTNDHMELGYWWSSNEGTVVAVVKATQDQLPVVTKTIFGYREDGDTGSSRRLMVTRSSDAKSNWSASNSETIGAHRVNADFHILIATLSDTSSELKLYLDETEVDSLSIVNPIKTVDTGNAGFLGARWVSAAAADFFQGHMTDFLIYDKVLDTTEIANLVAYLRDKVADLTTYDDPADVSVDWWLRADTAAYSDAGETPASDTDDVLAWLDRSGSHRSAMATHTASQRPSLNTVDTVKAMEFDGGDHFYHNYWEDFGTVFVVAKLTNNSDSQRALLGYWGGSGSTPANVYIRPANTSGDITADIDGFSSVGIDKVYDEFYLLGVRMSDADGVELSLNGLVVDTSAAGTRVAPPSSLAQLPSIGKSYFGTALADPHIGAIAEIMATTRRMSDVEKGDILSDFKTRYSGVIEVYDSFTTPLSTGLQVRYDANSGVYNDAGTTFAATDDTVEEWHDQENSYDAINSTTSEKPILRTIDSITAVQFDGTDDWLRHLYISEVRSIYIVAKSTDAAASRALMSAAGDGTGTNTNAWTYHSAVGSNSRWLRRDGCLATGPLATDSWAVYGATYNTTSFVGNAYQDGVFQNTSTGTAAPSMGTEGALGCVIRDDASKSAFFEGYIAEVLVYDVEHTNLEVLYMQAYLEQKWSVL